MAISIGSYDINNAITLNTDKMSAIKAGEDIRPEMQQYAIHKEHEQEEDAKLNTVQEYDDTEMTEQKFDAKEKGSNEYEYIGPKNKKVKKQEDGKVRVKGMSSGFDVSI
ncbi:MAG: hypothetical protein K6G40_07180 [Eubacterium sp.]|nr:hypothetical protein [Eubacterium sp.]